MSELSIDIPAMTKARSMSVSCSQGSSGSELTTTTDSNTTTTNSRGSPGVQRRSLACRKQGLSLQRSLSLHEFGEEYVVF